MPKTKEVITYMDEFLILLQAKLDEAKSKGNVNADIDKLQSQLNKLKVQVELDPKSAQKLANDIGKLLNQQIIISNINIDTNQAVRNAQQTGQQIGKQIQNGINSVIQKGNFTTEFTFSADKRNNVAKVAQKEFQEIANGIVTVKEQMTQVNGTSFLDGFIVNIKKANGEVESLTYRLKDMLDSQGKVTGKSFQYIGGSINDNGVLKQFDAISTKADNLQTKLDKLKAGYSDINSSRPIKDSNNISALSQQYDKVSQAIENVRNADNTTFSSMVSNAQREITALESMVAQFRNAENVATQMKSVDISSGIAQAQERLGKLKADSTGFEQMTQTLRELDTAITNVGDKSSLDAFIDKLRVAETQLSRVKAETKSMAQVNKIQLSMDNGYGASEYQNRINAVTASLEKYGVETQEAKNITASLQSTFDSMKGMSGQELVNQADKLEQEFKSVKASVEQAKIAYDKYMQPVSNEKATSLINKINSFLTKNTRITNDAKVALQGYADELSKGVNLSRWNEINGILKKTENSMRGLGRLGASLKDQMTQAVSSFSTWLSASTLVMTFISKTRNAITELKNVNTLLTEISKTNHSLTPTDLSEIGDKGFNIASKYGKAVTDYLTGVQDMSRSGYKNAEAMAEVSTAAQGAGDMTAEVANKMVIATDNAYKLGGSAKELTKILDGVNWICDNNSVNMSELSEGMSIVGSTAASLGVDVNELTAALGTMVASTQQSGSEVARAFKAILLNIRQVSDEEEGIDAEGLTKYEKACNALGVSLKETKNGILQTRDAMEVLKELSEAYNKLDKNDLRRTNLLNSVGGKLRSTQLDAILRQWDMYENMLQQFSEGSGTMAAEAEKTASSWEGSLNRLHNTWVNTVGNIVNSDFVITITNGFNGLLSVINKVTSKLGSLGTITAGIGIFNIFKNVDYLKTPVCPLYI
jgi:TP901 family phage tail tape measure protein